MFKSFDSERLSPVEELDLESPRSPSPSEAPAAADAELETSAPAPNKIIGDSLAPKAGEKEYKEGLRALKSAMSEQGAASERSYATAFAHFSAACLGHHAGAHYYIAHCLWHGLGVVLDRARSRAHTETAAALGHARGWAIQFRDVRR